MKRILTILFLTCLVIQANALNFPFGKADTYNDTISTSGDTVSFTVDDLVNWITLNVDTSGSVSITNGEDRVGSLVYLQAISDAGSSDVLTFLDVNGLSTYTIAAGDTVIITAIWDGSYYRYLSPEASDLTISNDLDVTGDLDVDGGAAADRFVGGTTTITTSSDSVVVSAANVVLVNTSVGNVTIGGFAGGVAGQVIYVVPSDAGNNIIIEDDESTGNQDIKTASSGDETITADGGLTLVFDGTYWRGMGQ